MKTSTSQFFLDHTGMAVPDLDAAVEWYGRVFEFKATEPMSTPTFKKVFLEREGVRLEVFQALPPQPLKPRKPLTAAELDPTMLSLGYTHIAIDVPDVDAVWEMAVSRGATGITRPHTMGGTRFGHISDMNQNVIELTHPASPPEER